MKRAPLVSSVVVSAGYEPERERLELEFASGRVYQYEGVPLGVYLWLLRTPSKGSFVSRMIDDRYPYRDVTPVAEPSDEALERALRASLRDPQES